MPVKKKYDVSSVSAKARATDPWTSHDAAASVGNISKLQRVILRALKARALPDHELVAVVRKKIQASESGIRTRRCELENIGLVAESGISRTAFGRPALKFRATADGLALLRRAA